jgi:hypothetical protein
MGTSITSSRSLTKLALRCIALGAVGAAALGHAADSVPRWGRFDRALESATQYDNPVQEASLTAWFVSPTGQTNKVYGFWDGDRTWRVRFSPNQPGTWTWRTECSDAKNSGLHQQRGEFTCAGPRSDNRFAQHGPIRVSPDNRYFIHDDGTPFFYLADTAWNGPLLASREDWEIYLNIRKDQKFSAVQFVTTQWRASPDGDLMREKAYTGTDKIALNPRFFQRLDERFDAINKAGLLAVPVMLWAINGGTDPKVNPGVSLPEEQAILLGRYMVGRWGAHAVAWILAGDSDYRGDKAAKWQRIGRAVFGDVAHAPVTLHPGGMQWYWKEFAEEPWLGFIGYQSGHGDDEKTLRWILEGPPSEDWMKLPHHPFINLEPPYENHVAYQSKKPHTPESVRHAIYWSLLSAPTAGVTYGGHGVWGWDDGTKAPTDHPGTGTPLAWRKALTMPGADQMKHLAHYFTSVDFWRLRPCAPAIVNQPGGQGISRQITAARTDQKDLLVVYVPEDRTVEVKLDMLPPSPGVTWYNPRSGETNTAVGVVTANTVQFPTPSEGDWILQLLTQKK